MRYTHRVHVFVCVGGEGSSMFVLMDNSYFHKQQQLFRHCKGNTE